MPNRQVGKPTYIATLGFLLINLVLSYIINIIVDKCNFNLFV